MIPTSSIKSLKLFRKDERQKVFEGVKPTIKQAKSAENLVQVLPDALKCPCVSIKHALKKQGIKTLKPLISQGFQVSVSILVTQDGTPTARGYNAPCFDGMVHSFATFVLMRWDTADGKDRIALLSQEPSCSSLYHFFNHLQLLFSIDHVRNAS